MLKIGTGMTSIIGISKGETRSSNAIQLIMARELARVGELVGRYNIPVPTSLHQRGSFCILPIRKQEIRLSEDNLPGHDVGAHFVNSDSRNTR